MDRVTELRAFGVLRGADLMVPRAGLRLALGALVLGTDRTLPRAGLRLALGADRTLPLL